MADFVTNSDDIFDALAVTLARFCKEVTGRKIIDGDGDVISKVEGEFIMLNQVTADQIDWAANEWVDESGNAVITHNYEVVYNLTAFRGKASNALTRILQALSLPYICDKYFPTNSPFAYSSSSTVSRQRVPLNMQAFENRATVLITFNVCVGVTDTGAFEDIERINAEMVYYYPAPDDQQ